ncbi:MAG: dihydrofolate reductase [Saprospirales bacterium]|nr:dihydrofolate reductase [Saprospirales bacterium]MBK8493112.1 dihydrofolate reductase [Saprospirales bacterium]
MLVSAIVAVSRNRVIGKDNQIPWYLPADLAYFKRTTIGHHVIMGRLSFLSIGRPLPKRTNVVVTRDPFFTATGCLVAHSVEEALGLALDAGETEAFLIGGGQIYRDSQEYWDRLYLTEVDVEIDGEVFFPELPENEWKLIREEPHAPDEKNPFSYNFKVLERVSEV